MSTQTIVAVPQWVVGCIQLCVFGRYVDVTDESLNTLMDKLEGVSSRLEAFALALLLKLGQEEEPFLPGQNFANNQHNVWALLTANWLSRRTGEPAINENCILGSRKSDIKLQDILHTNIAIEALCAHGVNLNICVSDQLPPRLIEDGPTEFLFSDCPNKEIAQGYATAHKYLHERFPGSDWFQVMLFAVRLYKGETTPVPHGRLSRMKENPNSILSHVAEAYEAAMKFEVPA